MGRRTKNCLFPVSISFPSKRKGGDLITADNPADVMPTRALQATSPGGSSLNSGEEYFWTNQWPQNSQIFQTRLCCYDLFQDQQQYCKTRIIWTKRFELNLLKRTLLFFWIINQQIIYERLNNPDPLYSSYFS